MKNRMLIYTALAAMFFVSCGFKAEDKEVTPVKPQEKPDGRKIINEEDFRKSIKTIEQGTLELAKDKEQGKIIVAGILATADEKSEETKKIIVSKDPTKIDAREMSSGELKTMTDITSRNTFINFGCNNIPKDEIQGLTEIKAKRDLKTDFLHAHAQRVFICGKGSVDQKNTVVYAQELYLDNSETVFMRGKGLVNLCAKTLVLTGKNSIRTIESRANPSGDGSPVFLSVIENIEGSGELHINDK